MCEAVVTSRRNKQKLFVPVVNKKSLFRAESLSMIQAKPERINPVKPILS